MAKIMEKKKKKPFDQSFVSLSFSIKLHIASQKDHKLRKGLGWALDLKVSVMLCL